MIVSVWRFARTFAVAEKGAPICMPGKREGVESLVAQMCAHFGVPTPEVILTNGSLHLAGAGYAALGLGAGKLWLPVCALELDRGELEALVAHEIGHFRDKVTRRLFFLNFVADITMLGKTFFLPAFDTFGMEFRSDETAVEWLRIRNIKPESLVRLLYRIAAEKGQLMATERAIPTSVCVVGHDELNSLKERFGDNRGLRNSLAKGWKAFWTLFFGAKLIYYFHPTLTARVERIRRQYAS